MQRPIYIIHKKLLGRYDFRKDLYKKYANIIIDVDDDEKIEDTTNKILKYLQK